ncbi:hypothetical protein C8J95_104146 [Elizabethkingia sp. YR214]|uniref:hypothetical protein n=1 Tax=Elizabethkingia sp. YR214 TaxID=2135667 RepID=UPI000D449C18|nr:hypothetical protein [Elizabethkingia sp. YR214]PUB32745.1 hypothetical protein C8J95_104146 [Elizabethkingia sp. YR214]
MRLHPQPIFHRTTFFRYFLLFILVLGANNTKAQTLIIGGNDWTVNIPHITEAGTNYAGTYESLTNQILLTISVPLLLGTGKVSVRYVPNPTWNNALALAAKRTDDGTTLCVLCSITGGKDNYIPLTQTDIELFRITAVLALAAYNNIGIQLRLSGVSVTVPAANYQARVIFTVGPP